MINNISPASSNNNHTPMLNVASCSLKSLIFRRSFGQSFLKKLSATFKNPILATLVLLAACFLVVGGLACFATGAGVFLGGAMILGGMVLFALGISAMGLSLDSHNLSFIQPDHFT